MQQQLREYLNKTNLIPAKSHLVIGVSGGVDSVVLLDLLSKLQADFGWYINVAHLDHKIRSDSHKDAVFVSNLSDKYGHKFFLGQLDGEKTDEAGLREARYGFFNEILHGTKSNYIVLAHHGDDLLETAIFNIIRGANREGHDSLKPKRDNLIRPLLGFSKADIIVHANLTNLEYVQDSTNDDVSYSRNLIRYSLMPLASILDPKFRENFTKKLGEISNLNQNINWMLSEVFGKVATVSEDFIEVNRKSYLKFSDLVRVNLLAFALKSLDPLINLSVKALAKADKFILEAKNGSSIDVLSGLKIIVSYDKFIITFAQDSINGRALGKVQVLDQDHRVSSGNFQVSLNQIPQSDEYEIFFVKPAKFYVRNWQVGDKLYPVGMAGSKKVQDIFVDKKIPRIHRASWPVVVNEKNEIVWLVNLAKDRRFQSRVEPKYKLVCEVK